MDFIFIFISNRLYRLLYRLYSVTVKVTVNECKTAKILKIIMVW